MAPLTATTAKASLTTSVQSLERAAQTLQMKAGWLRQHRSADSLQQMQTDAILDLCDAVRQIQQAMSGLPLLLPDVSAVREAAGKTTATVTSLHPGLGR